MGYKDYEDWSCTKCGKMIRFLKPIHWMPPDIKCDKCEEKEKK